ncbi:MAG: hypothetical protein NC548_35075 [Lachnospiraceae bacterium]|nr:hypothetical protein [Acetatifactor muris]MCM1219734.1 hypothetical protein [Lachnospiraceae bacterium]
MRLREDADITEFLNAVKKCCGEVFFETEDGDSLNLKSFLSEYLFSMVASNRNYVLSGKVVCRREEDYEVLGKFVY